MTQEYLRVETPQPVTAAAVALVKTFARWGLTLDVEAEYLVVSGSDGVMRGVFWQGHGVAALRTLAPALWTLLQPPTGIAQ
jgi:hypothetical protein